VSARERGHDEPGDPHSARHHDHGDRGHEHGPHAHGHGGFAGAVPCIFRPHSHDATDSIDAALESDERGIRAVKISFVALMVTALVQVVVVVMTGSVALLADTVHNFSDALTAVPRSWRSVSVGGPPTSATPTGTVAPRTSPGSSC
jgi:Cation efflux family